MKLLYGVVLLCIGLLSHGVEVRDYNRVEYQHFEKFEDLSREFITFDNNAAFGRNLLLGVATEECMGQHSSPAFLGAQRHASSSLHVATIPLEEWPLPLDECAEVLLYKFNSTVLSPSARSTQLDHVHMNGWLSDQMQIEVMFRNKFDQRISILWHSEGEGQGPMRAAVLEPGEERAMHTYLGHVFSAHEFTPEEEDQGPGKLLDWMTADESFYDWHQVNRLETCEIVPGSEASKARFAAPEGTTLQCDDTQTRFNEFLFNVYYTKRLGLNFVQPQLVPALTDSGFLLTKVPAETFEWLKKWYDTNKVINSEVEHNVGPCMNQHVSDSIMTHLPQNLKSKLSAEVAGILADWYGKGDLKLTSIYGIRKYTDGAVLRMHVDTVNTHVVSAIINVDQGVHEPWPLLILDHEDQEHSILMEPGDMVLYESAKLLHGRPSVFRGDHYDNIFIHYAPVQGWDYNWI